MLKKVTDALGALRNLSNDNFSEGFSIAELGQQKVQSAISSVLRDLNAMYDVIEESGFVVSDVALEVSLIPAVRIFIDETEDACIENIERVSQRDDLTPFQRSLLKVIKQIHQLNELIEEQKHHIEFIEVALTIPPAVTAHMRPMRDRDNLIQESKHLLS